MGEGTRFRPPTRSWRGARGGAPAASTSSRGLPGIALRLVFSLVIVEARVVEDLLAHEDPQSVGQLQVLDEEVVLGLQVRPRHRRLEVEGEPLLDAGKPGA